MKKFTFGFFIVLISLSFSANAQWEKLTTGYESPWILFDNSFPPGQDAVGYAAGMYTTNDGDGLILKTIDGGQTWTTNFPTSGTIDGIETIRFTTLNKGYAAGWNGYYIYTEDGGTTWTEKTVGTDIYYYVDIEFWDEDNGVLAAKTLSGPNKAWYTSNGGKDWTEGSGINIQIIDIAYSDATTVYGVGSEEDIIKSTDGGATWSKIYDGDDPDNDPFLGVHFYDADFGVVGGMDGKVLVTKDGGSSWSDQQIASAYPSFYAIYCFNTDSIYVGGTDALIYKSLDGGSSWVQDFGNVSSSLYQFSVTPNNTMYVSGSSGTILRKIPPVEADFTADTEVVCKGGTVNFEDMSTAATSWDWTFDGGTPSSSYDQNPAVQYDTPGYYNVTLKATGLKTNDTEEKTDYIWVLDDPLKADQPTGETTACQDNVYAYETQEVDYTEKYEWEMSPEEAGDLIVNDTEAWVETSTSFTGDFTLKVRATNRCADGEWSDELTVTVTSGPEDFAVEGGGAYCEGADGAEVILSGSETGVDYELYLDDDATGNTVAGTGSAISFGMQTEEGIYTVVATGSGCEKTMSTEVEVIIETLPLTPATPTGPDAVCSDENSDYNTSGTEGIDEYGWTVTPEEAGTITGSGMDATVEWNSDFWGVANVSVYGINDCGDGEPSEVFEVSVQSVPSLDISGEELVCDYGVENYTVEEHAGSTYSWTVTGGDITEGEGTYMITVTWGGPGQGSVAVSEMTSNGCEGTSEVFETLIDDCTGIGEGALLSDVSVYPNPASNNVNVSLDIENGVSYTVTVYNTMGQVMHSASNTGSGTNQKHNIDISSFSEGLYIINVQSQEAVLWRGKFEKNR